MATALPASWVGAGIEIQNKLSNIQNVHSCQLPTITLTNWCAVAMWLAFGQARDAWIREKASVIWLNVKVMPS